MKHYGEQWWQQGIPSGFQEKAQRKLDEKQKQEPNVKFEKIDFLDFSDYFSIMSKTNNWANIFSKIFPDKKSIEYPLEKLRETRNDLNYLHMNPKNLDKYPTYIDDVKKFFI